MNATHHLRCLTIPDCTASSTTSGSLAAFPKTTRATGDRTRRSLWSCASTWICSSAATSCVSGWPTMWTSNRRFFLRGSRPRDGSLFMPCGSSTDCVGKPKQETSTRTPSRCWWPACCRTEIARNFVYICPATMEHWFRSLSRHPLSHSRSHPDPTRHSHPRALSLRPVQATPLLPPRRLHAQKVTVLMTLPSTASTSARCWCGWRSVCRVRPGCLATAG
mmetsp:Transcript_13991/g.32554  ORF Transcript_13991/g.32554 Transcript_13991/m.32554 type:complete len:220 (-) Transcript_13991:1442-2101(-)